jgi:valyl-tRNA synthetase
MVMVGLYNKPRPGLPDREQVPFHDVYIHAMIQDDKGRPMKKSLGNGVDPLDIIATHGADALRFTLAWMTTETQDVRMPVVKDPATGRNTSPRFDMGRNFCNKLWNAVRFALMNLQGAEGAEFDPAALRLEDRWILSRTDETRRTVTEELEAFHFQAAIAAAYAFFWDELCDWYLEAVKPRMADAAERPTAQRVLAFVIDRALRLLHPFIPFITEAVWEGVNSTIRDRSLPGLAAAPPSDLLIVAAWPEPAEAMVAPEAEAQFAAVMEVVRAVRNVRTKMQIHPGVRLTALVKTDAAKAAILAATAGLSCRLAGLERIEASPEIEKPAHAAAEVVAGAEVYVPLEGLIDIAAERKRLEDRIAKERARLEQIEKKLENRSFVDRAPAEVVDRERARAQEIRDAIAAVERNMAELA